MSPAGQPYIPRPLSDDWCTPQVIVDAVHRAFGGPPDLDPCHHPDSLLEPRSWYMPPADGLALAWGGKVFVNPPFSKANAWVEKAAREGLAGRRVILLVKAAVDTRRWHRWVATADVVCFVKGRLTFVGAPAPAGFPVALACWGCRREFEWAFRQVGQLWRYLGPLAT